MFATLAATPLLAAAESRWVEPKWITVRRIRLARDRAHLRFVQVTDIHHKGDRVYLESMVAKINAVSPEFVCFTGDLIEEESHLDEALEMLGKIKCPVYGVPGNHDYWAKAAFSRFEKGFAATGGAWLMDKKVLLSKQEICLHGASAVSFRHQDLQPERGIRNVLLMHYPAWAKKLGDVGYDLILAGHSHGGQVRIPLFGPVILPFGVDEYDLGLFRTRNGPLYVNPGIGWFPVPVRFNCRPEITVFDV